MDGYYIHADKCQWMLILGMYIRNQTEQFASPAKVYFANSCMCTAVTVDCGFSCDRQLKIHILFASLDSISNV